MYRNRGPRSGRKNRHSRQTKLIRRKPFALPVLPIYQKILENCYPEDARIRVSENDMVMEAERWIRPGDSVQRAYPWDHRAKHKMRTRLTFFDLHKGRGLTEEDRTPFHFQIQCMMFSMGDSHNPLAESRTFVLEVLWQQMNSLLTKAYRENGQQRIRYKDIIKILHKHPSIISRVIRAYMKEADNTKYHNCRLRNPTVPVNCNLIRKIKDSGRGDTHMYVQHFRESCEPLFEAIIHTDKELLYLCDPKYRRMDKEILQRKYRETCRDRWLKDYEKEFLPLARRVTFTSRSGRRSAFFAERFYSFLGCPPIETDLIFLLDVIAQEVVAEVVHRATLQRWKEIEEETGAETWYSDDETIFAEDINQIRHYESALREMPEFWFGSLLYGGEDPMDEMFRKQVRNIATNPGATQILQNKRAMENIIDRAREGVAELFPANPQLPEQLIPTPSNNILSEENFMARTETHSMVYYANKLALVNDSMENE